ncbi:MAG: hypothetical protein A3J85_01605 [Desulfobacula sp. RIFOXYA12_FULL_46_16]|nr:MAG: hypothetical protein A2464_10810 [Deltaproteobacteria bacterium RIFOXYC2_FULL_48_10]OGR21051.1 MAG: hypothetical protein A3J85_01605 [Desulfobacula sp. RIFOXYA12_FULL_46_16]OGR40427.1 MAG: hypothetical protein A3J80_11995 [Desulfobacula sp. RIFOXYB2_FULL_45_6]
MKGLKMKKYIICFVFLTVMPSVMVFAEEPVLESITEIPGISEIRKKQSVHIGEYNGSGVIDDVHEKEIILNDASLDLSSSVEIMDLNGNRISIKLDKGQYIYYFLNEKNQIIKIFVE